MARRKDRIFVVLHTNVIVGHFLSRAPESVNSQVVRLWRIQHRLQLIVSDETILEYLEILESLGIEFDQIARFAWQLQHHRSVSHVNLGPRPTASRDPDDNLMLATALVGKAKFLITRDRDLLDIPLFEKRRFKFEIITPKEFLVFIES